MQWFKRMWRKFKKNMEMLMISRIQSCRVAFFAKCLFWNMTPVSNVFGKCLVSCAPLRTCVHINAKGSGKFYGLTFCFLNLFHPRVLYPTNIYYQPQALRLSRTEFWEVVTHWTVIITLKCPSEYREEKKWQNASRDLGSNDCERFKKIFFLVFLCQKSFNVRIFY